MGIFDNTPNGSLLDLYSDPSTAGLLNQSGMQTSANMPAMLAQLQAAQAAKQQAIIAQQQAGVNNFMGDPRSMALIKGLMGLGQGLNSAPSMQEWAAANGGRLPVAALQDIARVAGPNTGLLGRLAGGLQGGVSGAMQGMEDASKYGLAVKSQNADIAQKQAAANYYGAHSDAMQASAADKIAAAQTAQARQQEIQSLLDTYGKSKDKEALLTGLVGLHAKYGQDGGGLNALAGLLRQDNKAVSGNWMTSRSNNKPYFFDASGGVKDAQGNAVTPEEFAKLNFSPYQAEPKEPANHVIQLQNGSLFNTKTMSLVPGVNAPKPLTPQAKEGLDVEALRSVGKIKRGDTTYDKAVADIKGNKGLAEQEKEYLLNKVMMEAAGMKPVNTQSKGWISSAVDAISNAAKSNRRRIIGGVSVTAE